MTLLHDTLTVATVVAIAVAWFAVAYRYEVAARRRNRGQR